MLRSLAKLLMICAAAPALAQTHFHHAHLNSVDPAAAIEFYTTHLSGEKTTFDGKDAVWTHKSWRAIATSSCISTAPTM